MSVPRVPSHALAAAVVLLAAYAPAVRSEPGDLDALMSQLENRGCRYADDIHAPCSETSWPRQWFHGLDPTAKYRCVLGAARCLGHMGPAAGAAVPALIRALSDGPNDYDTGDGWIAARSGIASALGAIGDPRAIDPLAGAITRAVPPDRGPGAMAAKEPAARHAAVEALGRFGPAAGRHWEVVATVLRERNADAGHLPLRRQQYEYSAAVDTAIQEHRDREPGAVSFEVSQASIAAARRQLDANSAAYRRGLEAAVLDHLAGAAAGALGAFGRAEAVPLLVETLRNPAAAGAAAEALGSLGVRSEPAIAALEDVITSAEHGPVARGAATLALGRLGDERAARRLAAGLLDPELGEASARALAELGPLAANELPALVVVLERPIPARRTARGVSYDLEATRDLGRKTAAVRAIERIGGARARKALAPFAKDPDVGHQVRRALARMGEAPSP